MLLINEFLLTCVTTLIVASVVLWVSANISKLLSVMGSILNR